jgi:hypothetical protein
MMRACVAPRLRAAEEGGQEPDGSADDHRDERHEDADLEGERAPNTSLDTMLRPMASVPKN